MIYYIFFAIVFLSLTVTLSLTAFFKIEHIKIKNSSAKISDLDLLKTIDLSHGDNLIAFNSEKAVKKLLDAFPKLSYVEINKFFPDTLELLCKFDAPAFFIETQNDKLIGIAQSGRAVRVFEKSKLNSPPRTLVLEISTKSFFPPKLGDYINLPAQECQTLQSILHTANLAQLNNITKIKLNEKLEATLTYDDRVEIEEISGSKAAQILLTASEIIHNIIGKHEKGTICYFPNDKTIHFIPTQNLELLNLNFSNKSKTTNTAAKCAG